MALKKMYASDGITLLLGYETGDLLLGCNAAGVELPNWDEIVLAQRVRIRSLYQALVMNPLPIWTRGNETTLDPSLALGVRSDAIYVSHVDDLKQKTNAIQSVVKAMIDPTLTLTVWAVPIGTLRPKYDGAGATLPEPWDDARDARHLEQVMEALDKIEQILGINVALPSSAYALIKLGTPPVGN
ncbi:MAG: hypothetical protein P1V51_20085 [Deltaproteobacteria bacterium]|nr:hypothetical protein [Deltaproteobacteria bacterium]